MAELRVYESTCSWRESVIVASSSFEVKDHGGDLLLQPQIIWLIREQIINNYHHRWLRWEKNC